MPSRCPLPRRLPPPPRWYALTFVVSMLALGVACRAPFGADRHLLEGDRILAITVGPADEARRLDARAWLVVDGRLWQDEPVELSWWWSPEVVSSPDAGDLALALRGPSPRLELPDTLTPWVLGLTVRFPSGDVRTAQVPLPAGGPSPAPPLVEIALGVVDGPRVSASTEDDLAREVRAARTAPLAEHVPPDRWARMEARFEDEDVPASLSRVRWMSTEGEWLELDATRADWAPARLVRDDLEIEEITPVEEGPVTVVALALDDAAGNAVVVRELWVGAASPGIVTHGRWLATDVDVGESPYVVGRLAADDAAPTGLRLDEAMPLDEPPTGSEPWGTELLPCSAPVFGPFDPSWLMSGWCRRAQVDGRLVVVAVDP